MPETTRDRCITPSFSPSIYHHGKLMDGEGAACTCAAITVSSAIPTATWFMAATCRLPRAASEYPASDSIRETTGFGDLEFGAWDNNSAPNRRLGCTS